MSRARAAAAAGTITIGHRDSSVPFSYLDNNQKPIGFSLELCDLVVAKVKEKLNKPEAKDVKDVKAKTKFTRKQRWLIGREHVYINRIVRELKYTNAEKKRLLDRVNKTVDAMRTLERQIKSLDVKFDASKSEELRK